MADTTEFTARPFWAAPEQHLLDAGKVGELVIARVRVALTAVLLLVPIADIATASREGRPIRWIGFNVTLAAVILSIGIFFVVRADRRQRWLPMATSLFDVSFITLTLLLYGLMQGPVVLLNNRLSFDTYFLALGATCLRFDKRIALVAGLVCIAQWCGSVAFVVWRSGDAAFVSDPLYGRWGWSELINRVILLATATALNVFIVRGSEREREASTEDALTGVYNRRYLDDTIVHEAALATRRGASLSVAMLDVDHFKQFNDTHGHAAGDRALRHVARALVRGVRRTDVVARYGGEEFAVILPDTGAAQAMVKLEALRAHIASTPVTIHPASGELAVRVTVSIGVASCEAGGRCEGPALLAAADANLYTAKQAGRDRVVGPR